MPRNQENPAWRQLTEFERGQIVGMHTAGLSLREISRRLGRHVRTVTQAWHAWEAQGRTRALPRSGRPRVTSEREERQLVRQAVVSRTATSGELAAVWPPGREGEVSARTVRRRLMTAGLRARRSIQRLPLTPQHRQARANWCRVRRLWGVEWRQIVFSDESRFTVGGGDARLLVRRRRGERLMEACVQPRHWQPRHGVMVWGAISYDGRLRLVRVGGSLSARRYVDEILRPVVVPFFRRHRRLLFQQDNARPHVARESETFFRQHRIRLLPWPARSPDLSPIEHMWDMIGRRLLRYPTAAASADELWRRVSDAWLAIPQPTIRRLYDSLPRRVAAVLQARGGYTRY